MYVTVHGAQLHTVLYCKLYTTAYCTTTFLNLANYLQISDHPVLGILEIRSNDKLAQVCTVKDCTVKDCTVKDCTVEEFTVFKCNV